MKTGFLVVLLLAASLVAAVPTVKSISSGVAQDRPVCVDAQRGNLFLATSGVDSNLADSLSVCARDSSGAYNWFRIKFDAFSPSPSCSIAATPIAGKLQASVSASYSNEPSIHPTLPVSCGVGAAGSEGGSRTAVCVSKQENDLWSGTCTAKCEYTAAGSKTVSTQPSSGSYCEKTVTVIAPPVIVPPVITASCATSLSLSTVSKAAYPTSTVLNPIVTTLTATVDNFAASRATVNCGSGASSPGITTVACKRVSVSGKYTCTAECRYPRPVSTGVKTIATTLAASGSAAAPTCPSKAFTINP